MEKIEEIIKKYHVPKHVRRHCEKVAQVASELGRKMVNKGVHVDVELVTRAALLHDIVRVVDFKIFDPKSFPDRASNEDIKIWRALRNKYAGMHHALAGAHVLFAEGFREEARLVSQHGFLQIEKGFDSLEAKLLYYADKRVKHDEIVPLQERLADGRARNAPEMISSKDSEKFDRKVHALEKELLQLAGD